MSRPPPISARSEVAPFIVMDMLRMANEIEQAGGHVVHMEAGQPSYPAPRRVVEAARAALRSEKLGYTEALGIPPLRERIARHYREAYGLEVAPERVIVTTGSSGSFVLAFLAAFEAGARVAMARPGYPAYRNILKALGVEAVDLEAGPESRWQPSAAGLAGLAEDGLDGVLVASPANPTGTMLTPGALREIAALCAERGLWLVSDEIYHRLEYGMESACALAFSDEAIVINSFSKYYCMTGWRIGWMVVPGRLVRPLERLAQNLFISPPALSQAGALAAFEATDELEERKGIYARNREMLLDELPAAGLPDFAPIDGAFYVYADIGRYTNDSHDFAARLLRDTGVAATPGGDFDPEGGNRFLRFSFAVSNEEMAEGLKRLKAWLKTGG